LAPIDRSMKRAQKILLLISISLIAALPSLAQRYGTAFGVRLGNAEVSRTLGLTVQQRILDRVTLEGILQSDFSKNTTVSLLLQKHHPIISKRFNYYYGAGIGFGKEESFVKNQETNQIIHTYGNSTVGVDFIAGVELTLANAVISMDYKPNVNLSGREEFYRGQVGISARTVLVKSKEQKRKQKQRQKARNNSSKSEKKPFSGIFQKD
jgi:hypothetical protein